MKRMKPIVTALVICLSLVTGTANADYLMAEDEMEFGQKNYFLIIASEKSDGLNRETFHEDRLKIRKKYEEICNNQVMVWHTDLVSSTKPKWGKGYWFVFSFVSDSKFSVPTDNKNICTLKGSNVKSGTPTEIFDGISILSTNSNNINSEDTQTLATPAKEMTIGKIIGLLVIVFFFGFNVYLAKKKGRSVGWTLLGTVFFLPFVTIYLLISKNLVAEREIDEANQKIRELEQEIYRNSPEGREAARRKAEAREQLIVDLEYINGISNKLARVIVDQYPTIQSIESAHEEELILLPGVGKALARAIKARIG